MFKAILKTNVKLSFDNECNYVDYSNENLIVFKKETGNLYTTLAIIPRENILYIINVGV